MSTTLALENLRARLIPLQKEHFTALAPIAAQVDLFVYSPSDVSSPDKLHNYIKEALAEADNGVALPFVVFDKTLNTVVGCTRFGAIDKKNLVLHIGWTWIAPDVRGTGLNHEMKFLMLQYAFETLEFEKVEFRIDERNLASRKAVEKLGAALEGVLRKNCVVKDGFRRSTCCYGILRESWAAIKEHHFNR